MLGRGSWGVSRWSSELGWAEGWDPLVKTGQNPGLWRRRVKGIRDKWGKERGGQAGEDLREDGLSGCQGRDALEKEGAGTEVSFLWVLSSGT